MDTLGPAHPACAVGVIGAGRVGAVLAAALRDAGHEIVAAAGESDASRNRIAALLPGVPVRQADRRGPRLRPAPADRPRRHARQRRHHAQRQRRHPRGPVRRAHLRPARPRRPRAGRRGRRPDRRDAPRDDVHRHRRRPAPAVRLRLRRHRRPGRARAHHRPRRRPRRPPDVGPRGAAHALPRGPRPRRQPPGHPGDRGDGDALRRRRRQPRRHPPAAADRRPRQRPRAAATPRSPVRSSAATSRPCARTWPRSSASAPQTMASYLALGRATLDRVVTDGRVLPIRAAEDAPGVRPRPRQRPPR